MTPLDRVVAVAWVRQQGQVVLDPVAWAARRGLAASALPAGRAVPVEWGLRVARAVLAE